VQVVFQAPKTAKRDNFERGACDRVHLRVMGIISEASRHPKDVPFMHVSFDEEGTVWAL